MRKSLKWLIIYSQTHEFNSKSNTSHVISQLADQVKVVLLQEFLAVFQKTLWNESYLWKLSR